MDEEHAGGYARGGDALQSRAPAPRAGTSRWAALARRAAPWYPSFVHPQPKNPLHGVTLVMILEHLVERMGWEAMGQAVPIRCFTNDPSIPSSLAFLRRTPWARAEVEALYLRGLPR